MKAQSVPLDTLEEHHMQMNRRVADWSILIGIWVAICATFLALQADASWSLLFPLAGLLWMAAPLILTTFPTRGLVLGSAGTLVAAGTVFLSAVWLAVAVLRLFVPLVIEAAAKPDAGEVAFELFVEGTKMLAGGAVGIVVGVNLRRRGFVVLSGTRS